MEEKARSVSSKRIQVGSTGKNEDEEARTITNEEAIKTIKYNCYVLNPLDFDRTTMINTALDMARDALSKQIANQVVDNHHCPRCSRDLPAKNITEDYCECCFKWKYCPDCGQRLDWSDEE